VLGRANVLDEVALVRWVYQLPACEAAHTIPFSHQGLVKVLSEASSDGRLCEFCLLDGFCGGKLKNKQMASALAQHEVEAWKRW